MEKVLVTGATGFVGANLVRRLLKENYEVHILSRKSSNMWRLEGVKDLITDHKVDLKESVLLEKTVQDVEPDYIIHLAIFGGRPGQQDEINILESNLIGTINLLKSCSKVPYKAFINTGSSSEYGKKQKAMSEEDVCRPINMYGVTKAAATMYCNYIAETENRNIGTIRLFSPFGDYEDRGRLIPDLILGALHERSVKLANPSAVRDYIYIDDVCDAYIKVLKKPELLKGEIFNLGYGEQHSVKFMADTLQAVFPEDIQFDFNSIEGRKADTDTWVSDSRKFGEIYNWKPSCDMKEGLNRSLCWFKENLHLYNEGNT